MAVVAVVAIGSAAKPKPETAGELSSEPAPEFEVDNLDPAGRPIRLAGYRGRPVVLNFWASWCVPCRTELPGLQAEFERVGNQVAFVGINHLDDRDAARHLLDELGVGYDSGFDPSGDIATAYGLYGLPTTILIDPDGRIVARHVGELTQEALADLLQAHFAIGAGPGDSVETRP